MGANSMQPIPPNPYVGPVPFLDGQTLYGRTRDTQALADLLISKRIVLLIAPSGAGKTSLIQAALMPSLRSYLRPLPIGRLDRTPHVGGDQANRYVFSALQSLEARFPKEERLSDEALVQLTFAGYFARRAGALEGEAADRFPLIVLDQFEELFTLDRLDWKSKEEFIAQLGQALGATAADEESQQEKQEKAPTPVWALLSMREDHVAELEPFLDLIPTGLVFRYRLEPLEREQAIEAVIGPAEGYVAKEAAEQLADELRKVRAAAPAGAAKWHLGRFIEPVQLQVVCLRLWERVVAAEGRPIGPSDVASGEQASEVDTALAGYYDVEVERAATAAGMRQRDVRDWIQDKLITRTKVRTRMLRDPAIVGKMDAVLQSLSKGHVLRIDVTGDREWVELSHDRLIDPVLNSNREWSERHLALFQKQAKLWAEAGTPDDMLFSDKELDEAERFEAEHPEELSPDDRAFLEKSRRKRELIIEDLRQRREIEDKNAKLKRQRLRLVATTALALVLAFAAWGYWTKLHVAVTRLEAANAEQEKLLVESRLLQSVAMARGGAASQALGVLVSTGKEIDDKRLDKERAKFDLSLIEVLGNYPPVKQPVGAHGHTVKALEFSSDGKFLFSGGWDNKLKVWPLTEAMAAPIALVDQGSNLYSLAYNQSTGTLASTDGSGLIILWQVSDGRPQKTATLNADHSAHQRQVTGAAFNPEGTLLATASWDKKIALWNVSNPATPTKIAAFGTKYHLAPIYRIAFLKAGPYVGRLVSADLDGKVAVWGAMGPGVTVNETPALTLSSEKVINKRVGMYAMALSPSGRWIAAGDSDGDVLVWDLEAPDPTGTGTRLPPNLSHRDTILSMAFSLDSSTLVTVGGDEMLLGWRFPSPAKDTSELEKNVRVNRVGGWGEKLYSVAFHPKLDGVVAVGGNKTVRIADLSRVNPIAAPIENATAMSQRWGALAATPDLITLVTLDADRRTIRIWRRDGNRYQSFSDPLLTPTNLGGIAVAPDGRWIAALSCGGQLVLWSVDAHTTSEPSFLDLAPKQAGTCPPEALAFSGDGKLLATAIGPVLELWFHSDSGSWQGDKPNRLDKNIGAVAFSPRGDLLAAAGDFDRIKTWQIAGGRVSAESRDSEDAVQEQVLAIAFAPNSETLVSGSQEATVREWRLPEMKVVGQSLLHRRAITALAFGLREETPVLFSADREGGLVMCSGSISDEQCGRIGTASGSAINGLATSADLNQLVVAGNGLWVWDLRREELRRTAERLSAKSP